MPLKPFIFTTLFLLAQLPTFGQDAPSAPEKLSLWADHAPIGGGEYEQGDATITVHRAAKPNGAAFVICPGGGYGGLVTGAEGHGIAQWLNSHGITGVVLEYRLPKGRAFVPLLDAQRAIRTVRAHAAEWALDPQRVGIIGFSAGGHLASTAGTHFDTGNPKAADVIDQFSCRPDFMILVYPVISMGEKGHAGSRNNLLGKDAKPELIELFSNEKRITRETPPAFLAHALDDKTVPAENSRMFYEALKANGVEAKYLELPSGGHGLNGYKGPMWDAWQAQSIEWLAAQKFIPAANVSPSNEKFTNSAGISLAPIPAGSFQMGQAEREKSFKNPWSAEKDTGADWDEAPVRQVKINHSFFMGITEVTNAQYEQFDPQHQRPSKTESADNDAVVNVNWDDANAFCQWLSKKEGRPYRLPTEAEWEYACRAGTTTLFNMGDTLPEGYQPMVPGMLEGFPQFFPENNSATTNRIDVAASAQSAPATSSKTSLPSYYKEVKKASLQIGRGPANAWGLYGMHGNAAEWCLDWYAPYDLTQTTDPVGPTAGDFRVVRGGANSQLARLLRSANRMSMEPWARNLKIGFRVVQADPVSPSIVKALEVPPSTNPPAPAPLNEKVDMTKPFFAGPARYVNIPPGSEGPLFSAHNHDAALTVFPNGDVFILDYTCDTEFGHELAVAATRLPAGAAVFTPPFLFWQCADANNHAPGLFVDKLGTIFHFNGNRSMPGSIVRTSNDNGHTWSRARLLNDEIQPSEANIQTADGRILETCDSRFDNCGIVTMSADNGQTWTKLSDDTSKPAFTPGDTGTTIAGIHVGLIERKDGSLWALGRIDKQDAAAVFAHKLPISISTDGGKTWTYSLSEFPGITSGQRLTLKRLKEGPLLLCTFTDDFAHRDDSGKVTGAKKPAELKGMPFTQPDGTTETGYGMFAALSFDDGATWPVRRLVTPIAPGEEPLHAQGTDGFPISLDSRHAEPNGYLASCQGGDGRIHLISSRNYYVFNFAWLTQGTTFAPAQ